ncbi:MAG TPA: F0F1 ATP synthase subunit epsilon [Chloroflexi bacterium]|nr:F0F1 ATP synthase subunit epsilon [Chloroflexota bacterium]
MATLRLEIITVERQVFAGDVEMVIAPGIEGELGILPKHAPLITALTAGELRVKMNGQEESFAIGGGFMEVLPDQVIVLADSAERADEIDIARAEAARARAERLLREGPPEGVQRAAIEGALRRSLVRLKVARRRRRRRPYSEEGSREG